MRPFREIDGRAARWETLERQGYAFTLRAGTVPFATMRWEKLDGTLAVAAVLGRAWTFARERESRRVLIHDLERGRRVAAYETDWRGHGVLECDSGARAEWRAIAGARPRGVFQTGRGLLLVEFDFDGVLRAPGARVGFGREASQLPEAPLLVTFGWHLALLERLAPRVPARVPRYAAPLPATA